MREAPPAAAPAAATPAAAPSVAAPPPAEPAANIGDWTLPRVNKAWPQFIDWMKRSPKLENLRTRIVEKCWPAKLIGSTLTLGTASAFTRSQVIDRPQVQQVLQQCVQSYFKASLLVAIEVENGGETAPAPAVTAPRPAPEPPAPPPPSAQPLPSAAPIPEPSPAPVATDSARDLVGERMKQVFNKSEEITEN
jgi:hypothetical protein